MEQEELNRIISTYSKRNKLDKNNIRPIYKKDLVSGKSYYGLCRNSDTAVWDGEVFWYDRIKFGCVFKESINHFEDDNGYDVFVPFEIVDD